MAATAKKQTKSSISPESILQEYQKNHNRVFLKHAKKFAAFPELL
ncbi:MAG: hypothetical protein WCJ81_04130 [bacterium]